MIGTTEFLAVQKIDQTGSVTLTYDQQGETLYQGYRVSVERIVQIAKDRNIAISSQRHVIDNGSVTYKISK